MKTIVYYGGGVASIDLLGEYFKKLPILESFATIKKIPEKPWISPYMLDSGAFTAWKQGTSINLRDYIYHLKENEKSIKTYAALDVIGDAKATYRNYKIMRKAGLKPLPVWHAGSPIHYLDRYADDTNYIGIGKVAGMPTQERKSFLNLVFTKYPDPKKVGFHGFGIGSGEMIEMYPWRSVDATSVAVMARYGGIYLPSGGNLKVGLSVSYKDRAWRTPSRENAVNNYIKSRGLCPAILYGNTPKSTEYRALLSIMYFEDVIKRLGNRKPYVGYGFPL